MCEVQDVLMQDDQIMKIQSIYSQVMKESLCIRLGSAQPLLLKILDFALRKCCAYVRFCK